MRRLLFLLAFSAFSVSVQAASDAEKRIWACRTEHANARPIIDLVAWGARSYIRFAHMRFSAVHETGDGGRESWYWDNDNGIYRYGMLLEADGTVWYHDFSQTDEEGLSTPLDHFVCRRIQ